ncbi:GNAT family N-acetyltransferase [Mucilaginibacter auburnensis]|uniref:Acetyltransferase (GNAT) family protein n=1 Tax=Mucilaginibacter auburnensis TaxID=1457233 RepID=A0A2H9VUI0_9SPHI|nr:GNAT family N-acetyltransferase [Mucilaginibacter auburnensis]PJJ84459.1 acetyltransferase (GNAT) family protein [Mucilaginibacter auburnensis]
MTNTYTIRPIYNQYTEEVIDLIITIQQHEFNIPITVKDQPDLLDIEANYHAGGGNFWGAFEGEELVGTIALIDIGHNAGTIRKMFIKDGHRGTGLAQQLLDTLVAYSRQKNITQLYLGTSAVLKAAHRFYERNGFVLTPVAHFPSYFPKMAVDTMFYALKISY